MSRLKKKSKQSNNIHPDSFIRNLAACFCKTQQFPSWNGVFDIFLSNAFLNITVNFLFKKNQFIYFSWRERTTSIEMQVLSFKVLLKYNS